MATECITIPDTEDEVESDVSSLESESDVSSMAGDDIIDLVSEGEGDDIVDEDMSEEDTVAEEDESDEEVPMPSNDYCELCEATENADGYIVPIASAASSLPDLLYCVGCPRAYHLACLVSRLPDASAPDDPSAWICHMCTTKDTPLFAQLCTFYSTPIGTKS